MNGFVDRVWNSGVAGWSLAPRVQVSVNGVATLSAACCESRPDVQAAGLSDDGRVGFKASLRLASGDIVRVTTEQGAPLRHSPWLYVAPEQDGWLPVGLAAAHPEYGAIAALRETLGVTRFRPLFGQLGQVAAALLETPEAPPRVARFRVPNGEARALQRFHRGVLGPAEIAAPALRGSVPQGRGRQALIFDRAPGVPLDAVGNGWERWLPAVRAELARLQCAGERLRPGGGGKPAVLGRLMRDALGEALLGRRAHAERRFLLWLLRRLRRLPRVLSHGDLHRQNVLVDAESGSLALIDWDRWGYLPLGFDLALLMRGLPGEAAERLAGECPEQRLGVLGFTYLFQRLDRPGFAASAEGEALRRRCEAGFAGSSPGAVSRKL